MKLVQVRALVGRLRMRSDVAVEEHRDAWLVRIPRGADLICEVTIPIDHCFEWFACVKAPGKNDPVWQDWMDHYGSSDEVLDAEMAECIEAFVERAVKADLARPLSLYEESA